MATRIGRLRERRACLADRDSATHALSSVRVSVVACGTAVVGDRVDRCFGHRRWAPAPAQHDHQQDREQDQRGERPRPVPAEQHDQGDNGDRPERDPHRDVAPAQGRDQPIDYRVLRAAFGDDGPRDQVGQHAEASEEGRYAEQHAKQHRVDAEVLAESAGNAG